MTALLDARPAPKLVSMHAYLKSCGGRDVLRFDAPSQATDAARTLRERFPDLGVSASYDRVTLELKGKP